MKVKRGGYEYNVVEFPSLKDTYGAEIKVGSFVVFNYGGNLMKGTVVELKKNKTNLTWEGGGYAIIPYIMVARIMENGTVASKPSRVTNPRSIVVID